MPLINTIGSDPGFKHIKLQSEFNTLPSVDRANVIKFVQMGRSGNIDESIEFTPHGEQFIASPEFKELYTEQTAPPERQPETGVIAGLVDIIRQQIPKPVEEEEGQLKPENSERVGGEKSSMFEKSLSEAFKRGGSKGLASIHRELLKDPAYNKFLEGDT